MTHFRNVTVKGGTADPESDAHKGAIKAMCFNSHDTNPGKKTHERQINVSILSPRKPVCQMGQFEL